MQSDKPTVIFGPELLETGFIKALFKLGLRNRASRYQRLDEKEMQEKNKFRSQILSDDRSLAKDVYFSYDEVRE